MTPLDRLIEAVKRGEWPGGINGVARAVFPYRSASIDDLGLIAAEAFDGSLNAAHALHKAVVPGWTWAVMGHCHALVSNHIAITADADTPARAWLLAILRAMKADQ